MVLEKASVCASIVCCYSNRSSWILFGVPDTCVRPSGSLPLTRFSLFSFLFPEVHDYSFENSKLTLNPPAFGRKRHKACRALIPIKNAKFSNLFIGGRLFSCCRFKYQGGY